MTDENYGFCPACGAMLTEDSAYCPSCGRPLHSEPMPGSSPAGGYGGHVNKSQQSMGGVFLIAFILTVLYCVVAILGGIGIALSADSMVNILEQFAADQGMTLQELLATFGYNISGTHDQIVSQLATAGWLTAAVAIPAVVSVYLCYKRTYFTYAVILLAAASILAFFTEGIIGVIIGVLVTIGVYTSRDYFAS